MRPILLISLGLHGLLLAVPTPSPRSRVKAPQVVQLAPVGLIKGTTRLPTLAKPLATRNVIQTSKVTAPAPLPSRPRRLTQPAIQGQPKVQQLHPARTVIPYGRSKTIAPQPEVKASLPMTPPKPPQATPSPQPQTTPLPTPKPAPLSLGISEISGVPVDASWQALEKPGEALSEPELFLQANGQPHPNILGSVAQVPDKSPDELFEQYFQQKLETAGFEVEPAGTYAAGGGLYKLSRSDLTEPLYLTLAPAKNNSGTIVTIWNSYPQPLTT